MAKNLYVIQNGFGKNVLFTSLIEKLKKRDKNNISIMSYWPFVFKDNPHVENLIGFSPYPWQWSPQTQGFDNIIYQEPYYSNYLSDKSTHIIHHWADLLKIDRLKTIKPFVKIGAELEEHAKASFGEVLNHDFCIVQFYGGPNPEKDKFRPSERDYNPVLADTIISRIMKELNMEVISFSHENQKQLSGTLRFQIEPENPSDVLTILPLIQKAKFVITIDSSLMHLSACTDNDNVFVLWNENVTSPERLGYSNHTHFRCKFSPTINVDPDDILAKVSEVVRKNTFNEVINDRETYGNKGPLASIVPNVDTIVEESSVLGIGNVKDTKEANDIEWTKI